MLTVLGFCHSFGRQNPGFVCCYPYARVDAKPGFGKIMRKTGCDPGKIHRSLLGAPGGTGFWRDHTLLFAYNL